MAVVRSWSIRHWVVAVATFAATLVAIGVPTDLLATSLFTRMTPVLWWNYPVWVATALLAALIAPTYVSTAGSAAYAGQGKSLLGGLGSFLAVGCPVCNKLVVLLLGFGGALSVFAPVQPYLGVISLVLMAVALRQRLRTQATCRRPTPAG